MSKEKNLAKLLGLPVLGAVGGSILGLGLSELVSKKEQAKHKSISTAFDVRLRRNPKLYQEYNGLLRDMETLKTLPENKQTKEFRVKLILRTSLFVKKLTGAELKLYNEMNDLTERISALQSNFGKIGFSLGGLAGFALA